MIEIPSEDTQELQQMNTGDLARSRLDACKYIDLVSYEEAPEFMDLRVSVVEARVQDEVVEPAGDEVLDTILKGARPIATKEGYNAFRITFENYICFSVRDESYAEPEIEEDYSRRLRVYKRSHLLDYVSYSTFAHKNTPGRSNITPSAAVIISLTSYANQSQQSNNGW